jgi:C4-dicarboxylate transporter DctM subunit
MIVLFLALFLFGVIIGLPVAFTLSGVGTAIMAWQGIFNPVTIARNMFSGNDSTPLIAVMFFMLAGALMEESKLTQRLMDFAYNIVGHFNGGLAHVAILVAMIFAAMSGSAVATAAAVGGMLLPAMRKKGYDDGFSAALIASGGAIGPIIPPSIPMVIYAVIANCSVERMFLGGAVPGIGFGLGLMVYSRFFAKKHNYPKEEGKFDWVELGRAFRKSLLALLMPVIILGGIFSGTFTATEAACVAAVYTFLIGKFVYRTIEWKRVPAICLAAAKNTAIIMFIISSCSVLAWVLTSQQIPQQIARTLLAVSENPVVVLLLINAFVLILGCFMDAVALVVLLSPIMLTVLQQLNIDPVFFGVLLVVNVCIGALTPPVGTCLFVASKIGGVSLAKTAKAVYPMVGIAVIVLTVCIVFPDVVMFLPNLLSPAR